MAGVVSFEEILDLIHKVPLKRLNATIVPRVKSAQRKGRRPKD